jgi:hypothetical protein
MRKTAIPKRSHHKKSEQLSIVAKVVAPPLVEWSPADDPTATMFRWGGPLPKPLGTTLSLEILASIASDCSRNRSWWLVIVPIETSLGPTLQPFFVLRVGALHHPKPVWWRLVTEYTLTPEVLKYWRTS